MFGQAVALRVWGGGWLEYGHETWGVDLVLSNTPSYEWYVLSGNLRPGVAIDSRPSPYADEFALWDSRAKTYLITRYQTWGVSLDWYRQNSSFGAVHDGSVFMTAQTPIQGFVPFLGYLGGGPGNSSVLTQVSNSAYGVTLFFPRPGHGSQDCGTSSDVVTLPPGATMSVSDMQALWGSATPSLGQPLPFLACAATPPGGATLSRVSVNVVYRDQ